MKRAAFASLIGVSKQMVSKYAASGLIVEAGGEVDAAATLAALDGRLDETKRLAALAALAGSPVLSKSEPGGEIAKSAKSQKDEVDLLLRKLQYGREAGELVVAEEVDAAARQAVATLREAFGNRRRDIASGICLAFDLPPEKATPLARHLARDFEGVLGVFAIEMAALANPVRGPAQPQTAAALVTA